jgi:hypothetical protein
LNVSNSIIPPAVDRPPWLISLTLSIANAVVSNTSCVCSSPVPRPSTDEERLDGNRMPSSADAFSRAHASNSGLSPEKLSVAACPRGPTANLIRSSFSKFSGLPSRSLIVATTAPSYS